MAPEPEVPPRIWSSGPVAEAADAGVSPDGRLLVFAQSKYLDFDRGRLLSRALSDPSVDLWSAPGEYRFPRRPMFLPGGDRFVAILCLRLGWSGIRHPGLTARKRVQVNEQQTSRCAGSRSTTVARNLPSRDTMRTGESNLPDRPA
jgi:hypothetical protein